MDGCLKRQTSTAIPAEPGGFPQGLKQIRMAGLSNGCGASKPLVLLNASHSTDGSAASYLSNVIQAVGDNSEFRWLLIAPEKTLEVLKVPASWRVKSSPSTGFVGIHLWEQLILPLLARRERAYVTLCNANYVPIFAPRPIPILHCSTRDGMAQAETWGRKIYWYAFHLLTNLSLRRSSYAITTAHFLPDDYPGGAALRRKRRVFHAPPGAPQPPADLQKDPNLVVAVGNIVRHKKYEVLVRAIALVVQRRPETRLAIIGRAADVRAKKELGRAIQETGLQDRVELTGFIPDKEVFLRLQQASVLVSTSAAEAANMVVIEAMRLGTPVILGDLRGQRELAHGVGVLLPSDGDPVKAYAEAILQLLNDAELQRVMAAAGRQQAKLFDWSNTASTILDVLRRSVRSDTACKA